MVKLTEYLKLVGSRIRQIRRYRGLTQEELADKEGFQYSYIGSVERGERNISLLTLEKIAKGLNVSSNELFNFNELNLSEIDFSKQELLRGIMKILETKNHDEIKLIQKLYLDISDFIEQKTNNEFNDSK